MTIKKKKKVKKLDDPTPQDTMRLDYLEKTHRGLTHDWDGWYCDGALQHDATARAAIDTSINDFPPTAEQASAEK